MLTTTQAVERTWLARLATNRIDTTVSKDSADGVIFSISHIEDARSIHDHTIGKIEPCGSSNRINSLRYDIVTGLPCFAHEGRHPAIRTDFANAVVATICDIQDTIRTNSQATGARKACLATHSILKSPLLSLSSQRADHTLRGDLAYGFIFSITHINIASLVNGSGFRHKEARRAALAIRTAIGIGFIRVTSEGADISFRSDFANRTADTLGNNQIPSGIHGQTYRVI